MRTKERPIGSALISRCHLLQPGLREMQDTPVLSISCHVRRLRLDRSTRMLLGRGPSLLLAPRLAAPSACSVTGPERPASGQYNNQNDEQNDGAGLMGGSRIYVDRIA